MNDITSHLIPLLCKSSASKYMIIVRNITNENEKKMIKPISYYHYEVVVYDFTHLKKWNIHHCKPVLCIQELGLFRYTPL